MVAATVPTLRRFVSSLATSFGALDLGKVTDESSHELRPYGHLPSSATTPESANQQGSLPVQWDGAQSTQDFPCTRAEQVRGFKFPWDSGNVRIANKIDLLVVDARNRSTGINVFSASHVVAQDSNSVVSNDSQRMFIKKDVAWTVEYGPSRCD